MYSSILVEIPTPKFLILYNGTEEQPEQQVLKLSDAFQKKTDPPELELTVTMLNINQGKNTELMEHCKSLKEYMLYVDKMRRYAKEMPINEAVERTVKECIKEDILREFLIKYRKEAVMVSIFEYNEEKAMKYIREAEYSKGVKEGQKIGREEGENRFALLTEKLLSDNRTEDLLKAANDGKFRKELYEEYGL